MKKIISLVLIVVVLLSITLIPNKWFKKEEEKIYTLSATVLSIENNTITVQDDEDNIYTFYSDNLLTTVGDRVVIEYAGLIDKDKIIQDNEIKNLTITEKAEEKDPIPDYLQDNGIFKDYYIMAYNKLEELSIDEKIGQLLLGRYPGSSAISDIETYHLGGFVLFQKDFSGKTKEQVINFINEFQESAPIPLLTAVDEEGGTVVRISSNPKLADSPFASPRKLYAEGGFELIKEDTIKKSNLLKDLGLNVNLAPVVDVSTNPNDYMYYRSLGQNSALTSEFASLVINTSKGTGVSYVLKHFPGYGNNTDTHTGSSRDAREYDDILNNDIPPFKAGIDAGAEAIMVSHNIVTSIDGTNPASLSPEIHNLLRDELGFTGVIITDDLAMGATSSITTASVDAVLAGNDLLITTDYKKSFNDIKEAYNNGTISEEIINKAAFRILAWKYYKGLMIEK